MLVYLTSGDQPPRGVMIRWPADPGSAPKKQKPFKRQLQRIRRICVALPDVTEKLSHGEPTFFTKQGVFAMFANDHHGDGHVGVWLPAPPGLQEALIEEGPSVYYRPPYVGSSGWIRDRSSAYPRRCPHRAHSRGISADCREEEEKEVAFVTAC